MPSFKPLAADASPAARPAATRAVVPYRTHYGDPLLSVVPNWPEARLPDRGGIAAACPRPRLPSDDVRVAIFGGRVGAVLCVAIETYEKLPQPFAATPISSHCCPLASGPGAAESDAASRPPS